MAKLEEGDRAPEFAVSDDHNRTVRLSDFAGSKSVVLFFYPRANTPG